MDTNQEEENRDPRETASNPEVNVSQRLEEEISRASETEDIHLQNIPQDDPIEFDDENTMTKNPPTLPNSAKNKGEPEKRNYQ